MSIGYEVRLERGVDNYTKLSTIENAFMKDSWLTRDGRVIAIKDMKTDHIKNVISYLERCVTYYRRDGYLTKFKNEYLKR